jgi:hypothetical protein
VTVSQMVSDLLFMAVVVGHIVLPAAEPWPANAHHPNPPAG